MSVNKSMKKRSNNKGVTVGVVHINATFNNTLIVVTDRQGNARTWSSAGMRGFTGSRKSTPYAAQLACTDATKRAAEMGVQVVDVEIKGAGAGREAALRALINSGLKVNSISDKTALPHKGCRPPKKRRV